MPIEILLAVLGAAAIHASWNLLVKAAGDDALAGAALVSLGAGAVGVAALLVLPAPAPESWPFIAGSAAAQSAAAARMRLPTASPAHRKWPTGPSRAR